MEKLSIQERQQKNDRRIVELAPYLLNERNLKIFGIQDLGAIPSGVRKRIVKTLSEDPPLAQQGWKALSSGKVAEAESLFERCLSEGDLQDPRFFSVFWGLARIATHESEQAAAIEFLKQAITYYPASTREEHYLELADLILQKDPTNEVVAAAILKRGIDTLKVKKPPTGNVFVGSKLLEQYGRLEVTKNKAVRGKIFRDHASLEVIPIDRIANNATQWLQQRFFARARDASKEKSA